jgi:L-threonylcarbamoyladenylate synthase
MKHFDSITDSGVVQLLQNGAVGVLLTDTVYGIVALASDPAAVAHLYRAKHREGKPGTVIAANTEQLADLGIDQAYLDKVAHLWPNALSIILPDHQELAYLDQGKHSLAVRVPAHEAMQRLLRQTGPLLTSSANMPGEPPASTITEAKDYFGETIDFYVDGGTVPASVPSTLVRLAGNGNIELLRQGPVHL